MTAGRAKEPRLPQFIVIGAVKAATTWTAHNLREHTVVFMPGPEPHYFSSEYDRGGEWYAGLFSEAPAGRVVGEKSADYLAHPDAARRMSLLLPSVRLIAQLRNPVERAYSDYCMLLRRGTVTSDPEHYFARSNDLSARFLQSGLYARHISRFYDHFPRDFMKVFLLEDIADRPQTVLREVFDHIGIDFQINSKEVGKRKNASETPLLPLPLRRILRPFKQIARPMRDWACYRSLHRAMARPMNYPPFKDSLRQRVRDYYLKDIVELQKMIGRDLTPWLQEPVCSSRQIERESPVSEFG